jgi:hypothetical protein
MGSRPPAPPSRGELARLLQARLLTPRRARQRRAWEGHPSSPCPRRAGHPWPARGAPPNHPCNASLGAQCEKNLGIGCHGGAARQKRKDTPYGTPKAGHGGSTREHPCNSVRVAARPNQPQRGIKLGDSSTFSAPETRARKPMAPRSGIPRHFEAPWRRCPKVHILMPV